MTCQKFGKKDKNSANKIETANLSETNLTLTNLHNTRNR